MINLILTIAISFVTPDIRHDARFPGITLQDAYEFGVSWQDAKEAWSLACRHQTCCDKWIMQNFRFSDYMDWRAESEHCRMAWDVLDNALRPNAAGREYRLSQLERLRSIIGEEAYNARRMPPPTPGHLFR
jgi:hypothetical protein